MANKKIKVMNCNDNDEKYDYNDLNRKYNIDLKSIIDCKNQGFNFLRSNKVSIGLILLDIISNEINDNDIKELYNIAEGIENSTDYFNIYSFAVDQQCQRMKIKNSKPDYKEEGFRYIDSGDVFMGLLCLNFAKELKESDFNRLLDIASKSMNNDDSYEIYYFVASRNTKTPMPKKRKYV